MVDYLAVAYPKSKGKALMFHWVDNSIGLIAVYNDEILEEGLMTYLDEDAGLKWVLVDNIHADIAVRVYMEYLEELGNAVALHKLKEQVDRESSEIDIDDLDLD